MGGVAKRGGAKQFRGGCEKNFSRAVKFRTSLFKFLYTPLLFNYKIMPTTRDNDYLNHIYFDYEYIDIILCVY